MKRDQEKEVAAGRLAGCLKTVQSIRKLAFKKTISHEIGFSDRIKLAFGFKREHVLNFQARSKTSRGAFPGKRLKKTSEFLENSEV
jgi:hypothetical protein